MPNFLNVLVILRCAGIVASLFAAGLTDIHAAGHASLSNASGQSAPLRTAEQVHRLSRDEASRRHPAIIRGVVTCALPAFGAMVVQDATRGIYVDRVSTELGSSPRPGEMLEIEGVTDPGHFAPMLIAQRIRRLGEQPLPDPLRPAWDQLINGSLDGQLVQIEGIITAVRTNSAVTLLTRGGKITVQFEALRRESLQQYQDALVKIRGCLFASWNAATHQLRSDEVRFYTVEVTIVEPPPPDLFSGPTKRAAELLLFDVEASALRRIKVSGQILHQRQGEFYMVDGNQGLRFAARLGEPAFLNIGDMVEVVGFPSLSGPSPMLREAVVRSRGPAALPQPRRVTTENIFRVEHDSTLVRAEAILLEVSADQRTFELQAGLRRFLARLSADKRFMKPPPIGSRLELTGVFAGHGTSRMPREIDSFELLLTAPSDIRVLARPPWWTLRRMLVLVGALAAVLVLALLWIRLLHHRVRVRTAQLQREIHERQYAEHQRAVEQERARIARDLHDDLGSSLTEIGMLATSGPGKEMNSANACERLTQIAGKSRSMIHALDEIVWAVDPQRDTLASLARYLASYAEEYLSHVNVDCRMQIPSAFPDQIVSGEVRHHLFLAVKETLSNAVRHGAATEIVFRVIIRQDQMEISIYDNGGGFSSRPADGNGLANLRHRLRELGGDCDVQASCGNGTAVCLRLPLPAQLLAPDQSVRAE